jgi:hypothetical protein
MKVSTGNDITPLLQFFTSNLNLEYVVYSNNASLMFQIFLFIFFGGLECVGKFFAYVPILYFWETSGFEPRELP